MNFQERFRNLTMPQYIVGSYLATGGIIALTIAIKTFK